MHNNFKIILIGFFSIISINCIAQNNPIFYGGIGEGSGFSNYNSVYSSITIGGIGNGSNYLNYSSNNAEVRIGGIGEGSSNGTYASSYIDAKLGGAGEGSATSNYNQVYSEPRLGGDGSGNAIQGYSQAYTEPRLGGIGDGYASVVVPALPLTPLPLTMISFTGAKVEQGHQLSWLTANEQQMSHFIVERSANGFSFQAISSNINVNGNAQNEYSFIDDQVLNGSNYYRLRIYDDKGKFTFSSTILLTHLQDVDISIFPNPTADMLNLAHSLNGMCTIQVLNLNGQVMQEQVSDAQKVLLDLTKLPAANYFVKISNKQKQYVYKIVKR